MAIDIKIPSVGESVQEAVLAEWFKKDGDNVQKDEALLVIETDKVTLEVVAEAGGVLKILIKEGETVAIGAVVGQIETIGLTTKPDPTETEPAQKPKPKSEPEPGPKPAPEPEVLPATKAKAPQEEPSKAKPPVSGKEAAPQKSTPGRPSAFPLGPQACCRKKISMFPKFPGPVPAAESAKGMCYFIWKKPQPAFPKK